MQNEALTCVFYRLRLSGNGCLTLFLADFSPWMIQRFLSLVFAPGYGRLRTGCAIALYLAILILGSIPGARSELGNLASGLVLHSIAYSTMTFLLFSGRYDVSIRAMLRVFCMVAAMGAGDELLQSMLPYRSGALLDWLVDVQAAFFTLLILSRTNSLRVIQWMGNPQSDRGSS